MAIDYEPVNWSAQTPVTAKNMNRMEGQAAAAKSQIDEHVHPNVHYTKTESDAKFFRSGWVTGLEADLIDDLDSRDLLGAQVPLGFILGHAGSDDDFSNGYLIADSKWHICDGGTYNGIKTPDTRAYYPKCPSTASTTGTGGNTSITMTGTVSVEDHLLLLSEIPSHYHTWRDMYQYNGPYAPDYLYIAVYGNSYNRAGTTDYNHAGADEAHDHGTVAINLNAVELTPLYKSYYFICKVRN